MSKHLTLEDRYVILDALKNKYSFSKIAQMLHKHPSTIANEITKHSVIVQSGSYGRPFFDCQFRKSCKYRNVRRTATPCYENCTTYEKQSCELLLSPPYVCDGCKQFHHCTLEKRMYKPPVAQQNYNHSLIESRCGLSYSPEHIKIVNELVSPLIKQGQSIYHIYLHHKDQLMMSEKTLYKIIHLGLLDARPIDCPRIVRFKVRKSFKQVKVDRKCRTGRTYEDFIAFLKDNPDAGYFEMDTVEGIKGGKVLLTLYHPQTCLLLAFLRDHNDSASVTKHMNALQSTLGTTTYCSLFSVLLADNGSEFSNPSAIEIQKQSIFNHPSLFSRMFYCDGGHPEQKPGVENSHTLIRRVLPKGSSFNHLTQEDIDTMMNHINSYKRKKLNAHSPIDTFSFLFSTSLIEKLNLIKVDPDKITLTPDLLK